MCVCVEGICPGVEPALSGAFPRLCISRLNRFREKCADFPLMCACAPAGRAGGGDKYLQVAAAAAAAALSIGVTPA